MKDDNKIIELAKRTIDDFNEGYLEADMGYKFRTKAFMNVVFLYSNSVDTKNPDLLGVNNRNTFVNDAQSSIEKIKEQIKMDLKDMNFLLPGSSSLSRFVVKAANRKILNENDFAVVIDEVPDNAVDFGSGFLKVWKSEGRLKMRSIDPYDMAFNQYNFRKGLKIERMMRSIRSIVDDERWDVDARTILRKKTKEDELDKEIAIYQVVRDYPDGTQSIYVVDIDNELVYYSFKTKKGEEKIVSYYKYDYEKRKGFPDALGKGCYEKVFNKLVQSKVNRERMDLVMEIASKLAFQKQMDNERDNYAGKEVVKLKTGQIIGHRGNRIEVINTGGTEQIAALNNQINSVANTIGNDLNMSEALLGKTLPSGTSGVLGNLLTENSSSVYKDKQEDYAKFLDKVYKDSVIPYILGVFDSSADLRKYLEPNDIRIIERNVINYLVAQRQIDAAILDVPFNRGLAEQEVKQQIKGKKLISGELLDKLREEAKGIETFISGESVSKAQTVAFLREMRQTYAANPQLFRDPLYVEMLKKEAEYDNGVSGVEIDNLLQELNSGQ